MALAPPRRSRRQGIVAFVFVFILLYYLSSTSTQPPSFDGRIASFDSEPESTWLEHHMNRGADTSSLRSKNSFDWSQVKVTRPPTQIRPLPVGRPIALPNVQHNFPPESPAAAKAREARRQKVRNLFRKNWASYRKHAWMKDALEPISAGFKDQFSGWAATLVDSLDTLWIMGLRAEFDEAVAAVANIDFGESSSFSVNMFEVNIRYLGGLLAAYDLSHRNILLKKAVELGDLLYAGFNTPNRMPVGSIDVEQAKSGQELMLEALVASAAPGTLSMEMAHLSQVTGDPKYYDAITRVMDVFAKGQEWTRIPGLWPIFVSMQGPEVTLGSRFSIAGEADSLYEYLPKMHALMGGLDRKYDTMTRSALEAASSTFLFRPMLPSDEDILMVGMAIASDSGNRTLIPESEHLGCFVGGMYALAGRLFRKPHWVDDLGAKLTKGCIYSYRSMPTGIGPERWNMVPCKLSKACHWNDGVFDLHTKNNSEWKPHLPKGYTTVKDPRYILRPEAIESVFIMHRVTGQQEYQDAAWDMFSAIAKGTATPHANAAVLDVTKAVYPLRQEDYMEVLLRSISPSTCCLPIANTRRETELLAGRDTQVLLPHLLTARSDQPG